MHSKTGCSWRAWSRRLGTPRRCSSCDVPRHSLARASRCTASGRTKRSTWSRCRRAIEIRFRCDNLNCWNCIKLADVGYFKSAHGCGGHDARNLLGTDRILGEVSHRDFLPIIGVLLQPGPARTEAGGRPTCESWNVDFHGCRQFGGSWIRLHGLQPNFLRSSETRIYDRLQ